MTELQCYVDGAFQPGRGSAYGVVIYGDGVRWRFCGKVTGLQSSYEAELAASTGTKHMVELADQQGVAVRLFRHENQGSGLA